MAWLNAPTPPDPSNIVYWGPVGAGKRTNIEALFRSFKPENPLQRAVVAKQPHDLLSLRWQPRYRTREDRKDFPFVLLTESDPPAEMNSRLFLAHIADAVVFVADSSVERQEATLESFETLEWMLREAGKSLEALPLVLQYNKRDLPSAETIDALEQLRKEVAPFPYPMVPAVASQGEGVLETLELLLAKLRVANKRL